MAIWSWSLTPSDNATADASINWAEGQTPGSVNNSARAMMAALKAGINDIAGVSALGGAGNTFTLSLSQALPTLTNAVVGFFATRTNTGAVTLNVDSTGAKPLRFTSGVALASGEIVSGQFYICAYNTASEEWIIVGSGAVQNSRMALMAANTVKANLTASSAAPQDVTLAALLAAMTPVPSGGIIMWSGSVASVPTGWLLCDGSNGTPDLRNRFIIGAHSDDAGAAKTTITGSATQTGGSKDAVAVSHTHTAASAVTDPGHTHTYVRTGSNAGSSYADGDRVSPGPTQNTGSSVTGVTVATTIESAGESGTNKNLPPYYALAFIMKT